MDVQRLISDCAGHKDISTIQRDCIHTVTSLTEKADVFAKVFKSQKVYKKFYLGHAEDGALDVQWTSV